MKEVTRQNITGELGKYKPSKRGLWKNKRVRTEEQKRFHQELFIFESWFDSERSSKAAMYVGSNIINMVKTNTNVLKDNTKNIRNGWIGES